ncbi:MAG: diguanylate cyclase [Clostridium perfringens]|nr:diguanylate cyclase [Clostridium perfringens]
MDKLGRTSMDKFFLRNSTIFICAMIIIVLCEVLLKLNILILIGTIFILIFVELIILSYGETKYILNLKNIINKDKLTGFYNYNYFNDKLEIILKEALHKNRIVSVILIDINYFKIYTDMNDHLSRNLILKDLSEVLSSFKKNGDLLARYNDEGFAAILKDTDKDEAYRICKNIKEKFREKSIETKKLTLSIGVVEFPKEAKDYLEVIKSCDDNLNKDRILNKTYTENYADVLKNIKDEDKEVISSIKTLIGVINGKDKYTYGHVKRVVNYANLIAKELKLDEKDRKYLIYGAYIHDVGKISVSKETLIKKMPLNDSQWQEIREHPKYGYEIIEKIDCLKDMSDMVLYHHERYDGRGYPKGLKGEKIPYLVRVLTVIDSFDAMTSIRPYNNKKTYDEGLEELKKCSGTQFDPKIVQVFSKVITDEFLDCENKAM